MSLKHLGEIEQGRGKSTLVAPIALANTPHITLAELMPLGDERQSLGASSEDGWLTIRRHAVFTTPASTRRQV